MPYFADLTPYEFWPHSTGSELNVGWLESGHPFPVGTVPAAVVETLVRLALNNAVNRTRGFHRCDLCVNAPVPIRMRVDGADAVLGNAEIRVVGHHATYAAPTLIPHYISEHSYLPPRDFIDGVVRMMESAAPGVDPSAHPPHAD
jgi:hypothetical protein